MAWYGPQQSWNEGQGESFIVTTPLLAQTQTSTFSTFSMWLWTWVFWIFDACWAGGGRWLAGFREQWAARSTWSYVTWISLVTMVLLVVSTLILRLLSFGLRYLSRNPKRRGAELFIHVTANSFAIGANAVTLLNPTVQVYSKAKTLVVTHAQLCKWWMRWVASAHVQPPSAQLTTFEVATKREVLSSVLILKMLATKDSMTVFAPQLTATTLLAGGNQQAIQIQTHKAPVKMAVQCNDFVISDDGQTLKVSAATKCEAWANWLTSFRRLLVACKQTGVIGGVLGEGAPILDLVKSVMPMSHNQPQIAAAELMTALHQPTDMYGPILQCLRTADEANQQATKRRSQKACALDVACRLQGVLQQQHLQCARISSGT
jgi:hypothetical protein